jgi:L-threonylcarbamoyladenylate synthase
METVIGKDTALAADILRKGGLVAVPTETVYGLAANALDEEAVIGIYEAKRRPRFNPLILHVADFEGCETLVGEVPDLCRLLAERFSPGPLTYLLPKSDRVPDLVTAGNSRVAIRVPAHPVTRELLRTLDFPLAAPSANPSGYVSPVTAQHVMDGLGGRIPYILDGGPCRVGLESTIIGFEPERIVLYRHGAVPMEEIARVAGMPVVPHGVSKGSEAPGMQKSHYAPHAPLLVGDVDRLVEENPGRRIAVITFKRRLATEGPVLWSHALSSGGDLHEAARNLFRILREVDEERPDLVIAERVPDEGIGRAVNDRIERARSEWRP